MHRHLACTYMCTYMHTHMCTYMHTHVHIHVHTCAYICIHMNRHIYTPVHTYVESMNTSVCTTHLLCLFYRVLKMKDFITPHQASIRPHSLVTFAVSVFTLMPTSMHGIACGTNQQDLSLLSVHKTQNDVRKDDRLHDLIQAYVLLGCRRTIFIHEDTATYSQLLVLSS